MKTRTTQYIAAMAAMFSIACPGEDPGETDTGDTPDATTDAQITPDLGAPDTGVDADEPPDLGAPDTGVDDIGVDADEPPNLRTLADYYPCDSDSDCPVGLGSCVTEVGLNRPDTDGATSIPIGDLIPGLSSPGVCTEVCTSNDAICSTLTMQGDRPDPEPWSCQLVGFGETPYPATAPAFPFNDQLDPSEQALGRAFGALCRPPFGLSPDVDDALCAPCSSQTDCGADAACVDLGTAALTLGDDPGVCAPTCAGAAECPGGFECADVEGTNRCLPLSRTCSDCRDQDGDGVGDGRCGDAADAITQHDCDDLDPLSYYDADAPNHPFPTYCGEHDYNCNGFSDDAEQIGAFAFPAEHCTSCGDVCEGAVQDAQRGCRVRNIDGADQPACVAVCDTDSSGDPTHADCDGDITNGCEIPIDDPSKIFFFDFDGDGAGDPNNSIFDCAGTGAPAGYVTNSDDCDDDDGDNYPGNTEVCDGQDNDCVGGADEAGTLASSASQADIYVGQASNRPAQLTVGEACGDSSRAGVCVIGRVVCSPTTPGQAVCAPDVAPNTQAEICDGLDNDCDGEEDEAGTQGTSANPGSISVGGVVSDTLTVGEACEDSTRAGQCLPGVTICQGATVSCQQNLAAGTELCGDGVDNDCDGSADEGGNDTAGVDTYYFDDDDDGYAPDTAAAVLYCPNNVPAQYVTLRGDCADDDNQRDPGNFEICNDGVDNDCANGVDEGGSNATGTSTYYLDGDGDGYALNSASAQQYCSMGSQVTSGDYTANQGDCNDTSTLASPALGRLESCNGFDSQCDGVVDAGCPKKVVEATAIYTTAIASGYTDLPIGVRVDDVPCPDDQFVTGLFISRDTMGSDKSIDGMAFECTRQEMVSLSTDPVTGDDTYTVRRSSAGEFSAVFGQFVEPPLTRSCPNGQMVTGISGSYSPDRITSLTVTCTQIDVSTTPNSPSVITSLVHGALNELSTVGTSEGTSFSQSCPAGQAAAGFKIWHGFWSFALRVRGIQLKCATLTPTVVAGP